jgi:hypothetical protein
MPLPTFPGDVRVKQKVRLSGPRQCGVKDVVVKLSHWIELAIDIESNAASTAR